MSANKYQLIKSPIGLAECEQGVQSFIGRSGNGVCFGALDDDMVRLRVWILDESSDGNKTEWVLKHRCSVVNSAYQQMRYARPWTIADAYNEYRRTAA